MYALVLLKPNTNRRPSRELDAEHEAFITSLIRANDILLGGAFSERVGPFDAAYLVRTSSLEDARAMAALDPYVTKGSFDATVVEWELRGVNPEAIDPDVVLRPVDV